MNEKLIIIDCETTAGGNGPDVAPIEISFSDDGKPVTFMMCPDKKVLPSSTVIHGLTNEDVKQYDPMEQVIPKVYAYLQEVVTPGTYITAYNTAFDFNVIDKAFTEILGKSFKPTKQFDILRLAQKVVPVETSGNHRLDTIFYFLFPDKLKYLMKTRQVHTGSVDVDLTDEVLGGLWTRLEILEDKEFKTIAEVADYTNAPKTLTVWPMGKHRGDFIKDVLKQDAQYIKWFMDQSWKDDMPDLVYTIRKARGEV